MIKRAVSILLCLCLLACTHTAAAYAQINYNGGAITLETVGYYDIEGHVGREAIERWSGYGILRGYAGYFRPDDMITRAELAALMVRIVGYGIQSTIALKDVNAQDWFYSDIMKLYAAGVMHGFEGYMRPYDPITREEAITMIARTFAFRESWSPSGAFSDAGGISSWAAGYAQGMREDGYLDLFGDELLPKQAITRAETVIIIDRVFAGYFAQPGVYSGTVEGCVIVRVPNVTLRDIYIDGEVYIVEGVGDGFFTIDNANISGKLHVRSGRENPFPYIDPGVPMLALTFDDGPSGATAKILDTLEQYNARATFCVVGYLIGSYPDSVKRAADLGCELASHTWSHTSLTTMSADGIVKDCERVSNAIYETAGVTPVFVRPPYGSYGSATTSVLKSLGMSILFWSVDPSDWSHRNANTTYSRVINNAKDGAIILMHDSVASTATAVEMLVPELIDRGYQLVTVSELVAYSAIGFEPGRAYTSRDIWK